MSWAGVVLAAAMARGQVLVESVTPEYPAAAQRDRVTGSVILVLSLDAEGRVVGARLEKGLRQDVDDACLAAAPGLRFAPLSEATEVRYAFTFTLGVSDQQGNPVASSATIRVIDDAGLEVPGATVTFKAGDRARAVVAGDGGVARATFLPPGTYALVVEKAGFRPSRGEITLRAGETADLRLVLVPEIAEESIVVVGYRQRWQDVERAARDPDPDPSTGSYALTRRDVESTPGALEDVTRAVHKLPGVASDGDVLAAMSVRGMPAGNVSFTLDRVPLDNPYHLGGFNSIFNPDLLAEVRFYASAPPSSAADTTGALLEVTSWDGAQRDARPDLDGAVDISASSARVVVQGPVGNDFSFAVAGRRSYLELYLEAMKALDLLDQAVVAPEYDEIGARARWARGDHRLRLTLLRASDQLGLVDSSDESAITIDGTLVMDDELYLAALDHQADLGRHELETTVAFSADRSHFERDFAGPVVRDVSRQQYFLRSDLRLDLGGGHTVAAGPWLQVRRYQASGPVEDTRGVPAEVAVPIANFDRAFVTLAEPELRPAAALYAQHDWAGPVRTRAGVRTTWVERTGEWLASPSAGISLPLPTGTIPKLTAGVYHRVVEDALMVDANLGNPDLTAEQSWQVAGGVDQGLPWLGGGLFRVEGYYHRLLDLAVAANGSCCDATPAYTNDGTGYNAGIDVLVALRADRFLVTGNGSWLQAARTIPDPYGEGTWTLTPGWVQTWTAGLSGEYQLAPAWRVAARYDFRSGRPMSTVGVASVDAVRLATVNSTTLGDFHQVDLRVEWRAASPTLRWSVYLEVLNATYAQNDFLPIANVVDGELETGMFRHLPTRPFLGARVDF